MARRHGLCFIDDEENEVNRATFVLSQHFDVGGGPDLDTAVDRLGRKPELFLLDMYYGPKTSPKDRARVAVAWRELHSKQQEFYVLLKSLGQSSNGGLELANHVRQRYPGVPVVFITRKGSIEDADKAFRDGAVAILKKPDPPSNTEQESLETALDKAMASHSDELVRVLAYIMDCHSWWAKNARLRGFLEGIAASLVAGILLQFFGR